MPGLFYGIWQAIFAPGRAYHGESATSESMNQPENPARDVMADALKLEEGAAREAFIDQACNGDPVLRRYVTELLQAQVAAAQLLKRPEASGPPSAAYGGLQTTAPVPGD